MNENKDVTKWASELDKKNRTIIPTGFIPKPILTKKQIPESLSVGYVAKSMGGHSGVDMSALDLWAALHEAGLNPELITHTARNKIKNIEKKIVLPPIKSILWLKFIPKRCRKDWLISTYYRKLFCMQTKQKIPFDLVVVNGLGSLAFYDKLNMQLGPRILFVRESPRHLHYTNKDYNLETAKKVLSNVEVTVFCSSFVRDEWMSMIELKHSFYVPNTAPEDKADIIRKTSKIETRRELGFAENEFVIGCVASIQQRKGQDILLDQIAPLVEAIPNLRLELIGSLDDPWALKLVDRINSSPWSNHVNLVGKRNDPMRHIYALDVMILPTRAEAMPRVILEAMVLETPVVATAVDGIPEQVDNGITGFLFPLNEPFLMIEQIMLLYSNKDLRQKMAKAGVKRYWDYFSNKRQRDSIKSVLAELSNHY